MVGGRPSARQWWAIAVSAGVLLTMAGPRRDVDLWWHILLGTDLLAGMGSQPSHQWAVLPGDPQWVTGQPLAQMFLALTDRFLGGSTPVGVRAMSAAAALISLAWTTMPWRPGTAGAQMWRLTLPWLALIIGAWSIMGFSQERPAQVALVLMPWVGALIVLVSRPGALASLTTHQRNALLVAVTLGGMLWALSHQSWWLAAATLGAAVAVSPQSRALRVVLLGTIAVPALGAAQMTGGLSAAARVARAGSVLVEWRPTDYANITSWGSVLMVVGFATAWVMGRRLPDRTTAVALLVLGVAASSATRHLAPAVLAAAPILADAARPSADRQPVVTRPPMVFAASMIITGFAVITVATLRPSPSPAEELADLAAAVTCDSRSAPIIATTYNASGPVLHGARRSGCASAPGSSVVIDGRADRYGATAVRQWGSVIAANPGWQPLWHSVGATVAILPADAPLAAELRKSGWQVSRHAATWVALVPGGEATLTGSPATWNG